MLADFLYRLPLHFWQGRTEPERAVLCFLAHEKHATPSPASVSDIFLVDVFTVAEIVAGTGIGRHAVITACSTLSAGWSLSNVPIDQEPLIIPVLVQAGKPSDSEVCFTLNFTALSQVNGTFDVHEMRSAS